MPFVIQAKDTCNNKRSSGGDDFKVRVKLTLSHTPRNLLDPSWLCFLVGYNKLYVACICCHLLQEHRSQYKGWFYWLRSETLPDINPGSLVLFYRYGLLGWMVQWRAQCGLSTSRMGCTKSSILLLLLASILCKSSMLIWERILLQWTFAGVLLQWSSQTPGQSIGWEAPFLPSERWGTQTPADSQSLQWLPACAQHAANHFASPGLEVLGCVDIRIMDQMPLPNCHVFGAGVMLVIVCVTADQHLY